MKIILAMIAAYFLTESFGGATAMIVMSIWLVGLGIIESNDNIVRQQQHRLDREWEDGL